MSYPKITIITPSYNQAPFLEETILSIIGQNYPNLEYIIIDGGSSDNSVEIIKKYEKHLYFWLSEKDSGQSDAINKGLHKATGDIITWINSDDLLTPDTLSSVANLFSNCGPEIGLIHGGTELFGNEKSRIDWGYSDLNMERFISGMPFPQPSAFIRKKYWDIVGDLNVEYHYGMDYDLFSKLSLVCEFKSSHLLFSKYRIHSASKSHSQNKFFIEEWSIIFMNLLFNFKENHYLNELKKLDISTNTSHFKMFEFNYSKKKIKMEKAFFYFLTNVLRWEYINSNFKRAQRVNNYLLSHYGQDIANSRDLKTISNRLKYLPPFLIKILRTAKRMK